jgi:hypothetical protein
MLTVQVLATAYDEFDAGKGNVSGPALESGSLYTTCARLGCGKQVKRDTVCSCGMQN